jgi:hypothetical protein
MYIYNYEGKAKTDANSCYKALDKPKRKRAGIDYVIFYVFCFMRNSIQWNMGRKQRPVAKISARRLYVPRFKRRFGLSNKPNQINMLSLRRVL